MPQTKKAQDIDNIKAIISNYMKAQYRPYSTNDILLNLHNQVPKQKLSKGLATLVKEKELIVKTVGKTSYYCFKMLSQELESSYTELLDEVPQIEKETAEVEVELNELATELKNLKLTPSNSEISQRLVEAKTELEVLRNQQQHPRNNPLNIKDTNSHISQLRRFKSLRGTVLDITETKSILNSMGIDEAEMKRFLPQLAEQLHYSASDSSKIALWGTIGTALAGPISGAVVDRRGYTLSSFIGALLIISGYGGMKCQYDQQHSQIKLSCFWLFSIGLGSTFINSACLKCCAVSFPSIRGVATSLPLALYGLSALFYSVIASVFYTGRTSEFLGFVGISIVAICFVCFPSVYIADKEHKLRNASTFRNNHSLELREKSVNPDSKAELFKSYKFWLLFAILGSLASLGQMYIYSVGYIVKSLVGFTIAEQNLEITTTGDKIDVLIQQQQQLQVGMISIANCVGRILSGILGDIITQSFSMPRSWLLLIPSVGTTFCQLLTSSTQQYANLPLNSFSVGLFYGFTFCLIPIIVGDIFGMENFSFNWGITCLAPIGPSYYFTSMFGKEYDLKSKKVDSLTTSESGDIITSLGCVLGNKCYSDILGVTAGVGCVATILVLIFNFSDVLFRRRRETLSLSEIRNKNLYIEKPN
ncbi:hypothetical protein KGF57_001940 [Candida theae]|uniref:Homologous-pairing protein 2 winged helix domain-containing protein n=1 Tax=Candida theae TaxID=1198502 RepID=A0AAD5BG51_9ASCO|nr:uncharacterized protein KGF57_001940 [Candida theae]KAI5960481.1 hypothetical protein KGF57_001940 [Candida theae]